MHARIGVVAELSSGWLIIAVVADCAIGRRQEVGRILAPSKGVACAEAAADPAAGGGIKPLEKAHEPRPHHREHSAVLAPHSCRHTLVCK